MDLVVLQHLVDAGPLDVQDLASDRQNRLSLGVTGPNRRTPRRVALDDEQFATFGLLCRAVFELVGHAGPVEQRLRADRLACIGRSDTSSGGIGGFGDDGLALSRVLLEPLRHLFVGDLLDQRTHRDIAELRLGLTLELWLADASRDDRREAFTDVLAREVVVLFLQQAFVACVVVDRTGHRSAEALLVHAAFEGGDAVGEAVQAIGVEASVPLERDLDLVWVVVDGLSTREVPDCLEQGLFGGVHMGDEIHDPAVVLEAEPPIGIVGLDGRVGTLVASTDLKTAVEKRHHLKGFLQGLKAVVGLVEDRTVGPEPNRGAGARSAVSARRRVAGDGKAILEFAAIAERHGMAFAVAVDLDLDPCRKRVDHRDTHTVEAARHLVPVATELATGVQHGEHDLGSGEVFILGMFSDRDATAVVANLNAAVRKNRDIDPAAVAGHRLVDGVVDDFPDKMVQTRRARRADVHPWAFADGFEAFENGDVLRAVGRRFGGGQRRLLAGRGRCVIRRCRGGVQLAVTAHSDPPKSLSWRARSRVFALLEAITSRWSRGLNTVPSSYQLQACDSWQSDPSGTPRNAHVKAADSIGSGCFRETSHHLAFKPPELSRPGRIIGCDGQQIAVDRTGFGVLCEVGTDDR